MTRRPARARRTRNLSARCLSLLPCVAGLLLWPGAGLAEETPFVVSYGPYNAAPFALLVDNLITGGLIFDIASEFARRVSRPIRFVEVPRKRLGETLISGEVDMYCGINPAWIAEAQQVLWSPPLFRERDIFISLDRHGPSIDSFDDLRGRRVGTIFGYRYSPTMERLFADNIVIRDDAPQIDSNIERLSNGWIDTILDSDIVVFYNLKISQRYDRFVESKLVESEHSIYCALANKPELARPETTRIFTGMIQDGAIAGFLAKYR